MTPRQYMRLVDLPECAMCHAPHHTCACATQKRDDMHRAGSACVCTVCGREYVRHPGDAGEEWCWLTVLCDGTRVKL